MKSVALTLFQSLFCVSIFYCAQAQQFRICHTGDKALQYVYDEDALFSFSNGNITGFRTKDSIIIYDDQAKKITIRVHGDYGEVERIFSLEFREKMILYQGRPLPLHYDSTKNLFVTAHSNDSTSKHRSKWIWASPEQNFYCSLEYADGKLRNISFNSSDWQGKANFAVLLNGKIDLFDIAINKSVLKDYGLDFGVFKRSSPSYFFVVNHKDKKHLLGITTSKKGGIREIDIFESDAEKKFWDNLLNSFEYTKRGKLTRSKKADPAMNACN